MIGDARTGALQQSFLHGPETDEGYVGAVAAGDECQLFVVHRIACQRLLIAADALYVASYGLIAHHAEHRLAAMAEVEVDVGVPDYRGFAVFAVFEDGRLRDAILLAQCLAEQQIGCCALLAPQFEFEAQALLAALLAE